MILILVDKQINFSYGILKIFIKNTTKNNSPWNYLREYGKRNDFVILPAKLGSGEFGIVWKGTITATGETVAVKTVNSNVLHTCNEQSMQNTNQCNRCESLVMIIRETKVMQRIQVHPHVLQMVAVCTEEIRTDGECYLFTEFCAGGQLKEYLMKFKAATREQLANNPHAVAYQNQGDRRYLIPNSAAASLEKQCLLSYCSQITDGMNYLASIPLLHRDLGL